MVQTLITADHTIEVSGVGYDPHGGFSINNTDIILSDYAEATELARAALLCNDAHLEETEGGWKIHGDPTEGGLGHISSKNWIGPPF